jgi:hypothetical protein
LPSNPHSVHCRRFEATKLLDIYKWAAVIGILLQLLYMLFYLLVGILIQLKQIFSAFGRKIAV